MEKVFRIGKRSKLCDRANKYENEAEMLLTDVQVWNITFFAQRGVPYYMMSVDCSDFVHKPAARSAVCLFLDLAKDYFGYLL